MRTLVVLAISGFNRPFKELFHFPDIFQVIKKDFRFLLYFPADAFPPCPVMGQANDPADTDAPFLVVNGDIWTTYSFARLRAVKCDYAHLVMVPNPAHNPEGDFALRGAVLKNDGAPKLTFSGIGVYHPRLFTQCSPGKFPLAPILQQAMEEQIVTGERFDGPWNDAGTMERLGEIENTV